MSASPGRKGLYETLANLTSQTPDKKQGEPSKDDGLLKLVDMLQSIDETKKMAVLNSTTIADNNGGRIEL